jgi:hypothetical protein
MEKEPLLTSARTCSYDGGGEDGIVLSCTTLGSGGEGSPRSSALCRASSKEGSCRPRMECPEFSSITLKRVPSAPLPTITSPDGEEVLLHLKQKSFFFALWFLSDLGFFLGPLWPPKMVLLCRHLFYLLCQQSRGWLTFTWDVPFLLLRKIHFWVNTTLKH